MELRLAVDGRDTDFESLGDWLREEPELRGRVRMHQAAPPPGAMGGELFLAVATPTAAVLSVVARSLFAYLRERRRTAGADLRVKVIRSDGTRLELTAERVTTPEDVLRLVTSADAVAAGQDAGRAPARP